MGLHSEWVTGLNVQQEIEDSNGVTFCDDMPTWPRLGVTFLSLYKQYNLLFGDICCYA